MSRNARLLQKGLATGYTLMAVCVCRLAIRWWQCVSVAWPYVDGSAYLFACLFLTLFGHVCGQVCCSIVQTRAIFFSYLSLIVTVQRSLNMLYIDATTVCSGLRQSRLTKLWANYALLLARVVSQLSLLWADSNTLMFLFGNLWHFASAPTCITVSRARAQISLVAQ